LGIVLALLILVFPPIACLAIFVILPILAYQAYLGYLAVRSSMNLDQNKGIITVVVAFFATFIVNAIVGGILRGIFGVVS
jgi:hypothetical protein